MLTINNQDDNIRRYTRKHKVDTQYKYEAEKTSALIMESKKISVLACVWNKCFAIASWYVLS